MLLLARFRRFGQHIPSILQARANLLVHLRTDYPDYRLVYQLFFVFTGETLLRRTYISIMLDSIIPRPSCIDAGSSFDPRLFIER